METRISKVKIFKTTKTEIEDRNIEKKSNTYKRETRKKSTLPRITNEERMQCNKLEKYTQMICY